MMEDIKVNKTLTQFKGKVEYTSYYEPDFGFGEYEEGDWTTEEFKSIRGLLKLLADEHIEKIKDDIGGDKVVITAIYLDGKGEDENSASMMITEKGIKGWTTQKTKVSDVDAQMLRCVNEVEKLLNEGLSRIKVYKG